MQDQCMVYILWASMSTLQDFKLSTVPYFNSEQRSLYPYVVFILEKFLFLFLKISFPQYF